MPLQFRESSLEEKGEGLERRTWSHILPRGLHEPERSNPQKGLPCSQPVPTAPKRCGRKIY